MFVTSIYFEKFSVVKIEIEWGLKRKSNPVRMSSKMIINWDSHNASLEELRIKQERVYKNSKKIPKLISCPSFQIRERNGNTLPSWKKLTAEFPPALFYRSLNLDRPASV